MATGRKTVAPGQTIASEWGNFAWDQSVQQFASTADRNTQFPAPLDGAVCYTAVEKTWWVRVSGVWRTLVTDTGPAVHAPTLRTRQPADQSFGAGVMTGMAWAADAAWPAASTTGYLSYSGSGVQVDRAGVCLAVLTGFAVGGRFEWDLLAKGQCASICVGGSDINAASASALVYMPAASTFGARAYGFVSGTLKADNIAIGNPHGLTVTYLGTTT